MRVSDAMMSGHTRLWLLKAQERMFQDQSRAASGKRIERPSDDPAASARLARLHSDFSRNEQFLSDINSAGSWLKSSESALGSVTDLVRSLRDIAVSGASTSDASGPLAAQVRQIQAQLLDVANTQIDGRYLLAGQATLTRPFDETGGSPPVSYAGAVTPVSVSILPGTSLEVGVTGDRVLNMNGAASPAHDDIFAVCSQLASALDSGDGAAVTQMIGELDFHLTTVLQARGEVGARIQICEAAQSRIESAQDAATIAISDTEDVDLSEVLVDLSEAQNAYQASASMAASLHSVSLLDFLK